MMNSGRRAFALAGGLATIACGGVFSGAVDLPVSAKCDAPSFDATRVITETGEMKESADRCWWLSSGAQLSVEDGLARTVVGELPGGSEWQQRYAQSSPVDTDNGAHPQNLFRLVTRERWQDSRHEVSFRILRLNLSDSPERGEWNGVLLFQRYQDSDNLYYAGLRVDGTAVIKKKLAGQYFTLAQRSIFGDPADYDRRSNPSLLPSARWIRIAAVTSDEPGGAVRISLLVNDGQDPGAWVLAAEALDRGEQGAPIREEGHAGLRTDFMDVEFSDYQVFTPKEPETSAPKVLTGSASPARDSGKAHVKGAAVHAGAQASPYCNSFPAPGAPVPRAGAQATRQCLESEAFSGPGIVLAIEQGEGYVPPNIHQVHGYR